ncbi:unnamed protein product [Rotaria sordida]|uniref:Uncharacterized protein n=1 Tax=Rotaria sordida TaxID=392033 RepID=A0A814TT91_9BILA|nr:unnamed protein product [Rotaria sordida]
MSGLRKSLPIHKPITTIDQNLEDGDDEKVFVTSKYKKMIPPITEKPNNLSNDENATLFNGTYSLTIKTIINNEVEVKLTSDEVTEIQGKRKKI